MSDTVVRNGSPEEKARPATALTSEPQPSPVAKNTPIITHLPSDLSSQRTAADNGDTQWTVASKVPPRSNPPHGASVHPASSLTAASSEASRTQVPNTSTNTASSEPDVHALETGKAEAVPKSPAVSEKTRDAADRAKGRKSTKKEKPAAKSSKGKISSQSKSKKSRELGAIQNASAPSAADPVPSDKTSAESAITNGKKRINRKRKESEASESEPEPRTGKRVRLQHLPFQHPAAQQIPQFYRHSFSSHKATPRDSADDKIVVFNRGDFLAVRNDSDSFYVCRTTQNVYKTSRKFKIQWLQNDKNKDIYELDFLDQTDFECVLTNLRLNRLSKGEYELPPDEKQRALNILQRAINVERGVTDVPDLRQVAADGIDVSVVGRKEEKELLKLEAHSKKELPSAAKVKAPKPSEPPAKTAGRPRKLSTDSNKSSRKTETSRKESSKKSESSRHDSRKDVKAEKSRKRESQAEEKPVVEAKSKKIREKRSGSSSASSTSTGAKSKDQVLVEKIVDEIVKKHKIKKSETEEKQKADRDVRAGKEVQQRSSRLTRGYALITPVPPPNVKVPQHHETIRGLVSLLNSFSSNGLRSSALLTLERLASDYPKDCLPFLVETLLNSHRAFQENDDNFIPGSHFPRRVGRESPPKSKSPKSLFQMYFNQKMLNAKFGVDKDYDRAVIEYYASYYSFIVSVCRIGIRSDFVSGDLVSLCSIVALESLPTGTPVFVSFWRELVEAEAKGQESQFLEVLGHCPNFRNYIIAILSQERKFLVHDSNFELAKSLAPKVKTMSSLTQKLVSTRSTTLIGDIAKDYPSVEAVKDLQVFSTVLRALNLSLLYESKTNGSEKFKSVLTDLKNQFEKTNCNGNASCAGSPHKEHVSVENAGKTNGISKASESPPGLEDKINRCMNSILQLLDISK